MLFPVWLQEFTLLPSTPQDGRWKLRLVCMGAQKQIVTLPNTSLSIKCLLNPINCDWRTPVIPKLPNLYAKKYPISDHPLSQGAAAFPVMVGVPGNWAWAGLSNKSFRGVALNFLWEVWACNTTESPQKPWPCAAGLSTALKTTTDPGI